MSETIKRKCCRMCRRERLVKKQLIEEKPKFEMWLCDECGKQYKSAKR